MKATVIEIFIISLFLLPFASSLDFEIDAPASINVDEEFFISISADSSLSYDVKIYVQDDKKEYSEILNEGEWKSTLYYVPSAFPDKKQFKLKAHKSGDTEICLQLRESGQTSKFEKKCEPISVLANTNDEVNGEEEDEVGNTNDINNNNQEDDKDENEDKDNNDEEDEDEVNDREEDENSPSDRRYLSNKIPSHSTSIKNRSNIAKVDDEVIELNKVSTSLQAKSKVYVTKQGKMRLIMLSAFAIFVAVVLVIIAGKARHR